MDSDRIYEPLPEYRTTDEIAAILKDGSYQELLVLPLAVGESWPDWKYAQDLCLQLADHEDEAIRANACLGLAYIARTKGQLEKHRVKPVILRELRRQQEHKGRIEDAIGDINIFMPGILS